ncbi:MAG: HAMP domain-containing sensor histidine kinase [Bryobacteraceae bacterium]
MASEARRATWQLGLVGLLAAVLVLLAVLQYRWSLEISRAERTRIETGLNTSMAQFRQEFYRELTQLSTAFHSDPTADPGDLLQVYAARYEEWSRTSARPDLLANLYVWQEGKLLRLVPADGSFASADWPASWGMLRSRVESEAQQPATPPGAPPGPMRGFAWNLEEGIPALLRPVFDFSGPRPGGAGFRGGPPRALLGFVILELNRGALEHMFGELAQRYFSGPDGFIYHVAVVSRTDGQLIYNSEPQSEAGWLQAPDARAALLPGTPVETRGMEGPPPARTGAGRKGFGRRTSGARQRGAAILPSGSEEPWQLLARHKGGSLESVVTAERRRNLLLSFGVLLLLAASMALIVLSAQRARRLARLQLEFVAGVSHELRTPVSVICSAADNLAEGFVGAREQVKEYGALIRTEGRRLAGMIEQILRFAAGQSRPMRYEVTPVPVAAAIGAVLANVASLPEAEGFSIEREFGADLPPVQADGAALSRCLENLILNAFKYSGESRWVRIRAAGAEGGSRVRISVEDGGPGIDPTDLPHIFEPFYRGKAAQAGQIHGTGLGLSLARDIAEGMGGRLDVASEPGRGSIFTLELAAGSGGRPAAEPLSRTA